ncbi:MAG: AAA family ATPase [Chitinophagaceae bacterium]|nr:AAA family ATPase [Chitinophagaceae bacterium]
MEYFRKLLDLLRLERQEDRRSYEELIEKSSVTERRANGVSWYPIAIRGTEMSRGDYLTVEVERTTHQDLSHQLRFGASAALFSNHDPKNNRLEGTISYQSGDRLKLTLRTDELPEWIRDGKLGIDLLFDDYSYDEMQSALKLATTLGEKTNEDHLIKVLIGEKPATFNPGMPAFFSRQLNNSQQKAVEQIIAANELAIVHGPPGTGKTTTLVQSVTALIKQEHQKILVVAASNTAVDLLTEKIAEEGINVIRVGNPARVSDRLMSLTLDNKIAEHGSMKEIKKLKKQAAEFRDMAHKYKRNFGRAERDQRKALFTEARNIMKQVENTEQYITDDLLGRAQVITATLVGANHYTVRNLKFRTVIIDEAGQALEPACWISILKAQKLIIAGDHYQLPPTIKSTEAALKGLSTTLLEKLVTIQPQAVTLLEEQYRMNEIIMGFSSKIFYENKLKAHPSVAHHVLFQEDLPLAFIDTAGCGFEEKAEGTSSTNPEEASFVVTHLMQLVTELKDHYQTTDFPTIAVISPYKEQIYLLKELVTQSSVFRPYHDKISVNTIDSFQGQERDVVYISMTRSNTENKIGFLSDIRRMNVAMTRARKKLVMIGDSGTLSHLPFYAELIAYAEQRNCYRSAWEFVNN